MNCQKKSHPPPKFPRTPQKPNQKHARIHRNSRRSSGAPQGGRATEECAPPPCLQTPPNSLQGCDRQGDSLSQQFPTWSRILQDARGARGPPRKARARQEGPEAQEDPARAYS